MSKASGPVKPGKRNEKHSSRACSRCQRRKIKCDGVLPRCGACVHKGEECKPSTRPDRRTAAGRSDSGLVARLSELEAENAALKEENALLRAQIAQNAIGAAFALDQQPVYGGEGITASSSGVGTEASMLLQLGPAPSTYAPRYDAQTAPIGYGADGGRAQYSHLPAPPLEPLILGADFDCIGNLTAEPTLFPFANSNALNF